MSRPLRVLIVEDAEDDAALLLRQLRRGGFDPEFERVDTAEGMSAALDRQDWEIVIADYSMPRFSAPAALSLVKRRGLDLPFIIVSGTIGEETAVEAMRSGAHDYLMKGHLARLCPAVDRELREAASRATRRQAETALRESEARLKAIIGSAMDAIITVDGEQCITVFNAAAEKIFRCPASDAIGRPLDRFIPERFRAAHRAHVSAFGETGMCSRSMSARPLLAALRADGEEFPMEATISQVEVAGEKLYTVILRDLSERRRAAETEARLQTAWEQEHQIAHALRQTYLPRAMPDIPELEFADDYRPAIQKERVGGDFYEALVLDARSVAFCIGDVSGKGLEAALDAAAARSMWRAFIGEETDPGLVLTRLNRALARYMVLGQFVTMVCGVIDRCTGDLTYAVAGHPAPLLRRASGGCEALPGGGLVLGVAPDFHYETERTCLHLGDLLLLCTDGVTELRHSREMLEIEGLQRWLAECPVEPAEATIKGLCERAQDWTHHNFHDDVALLAIRRRSPSAAKAEAPGVTVWRAGSEDSPRQVGSDVRRCA